MLDTEKYLNFDFVETVKNLSIGEKQEIDVNNLIFTVNDTNNINCNVSINTFKHKLIHNKFTNNKSVIIICSKDNSAVLDFTLTKLVQNKTNTEHDILLVDDRSSSTDIENLSIKYGVSYLRIDNNHDVFNYSVLNNIATVYAKALGKDLIIFYNNDMWFSKKNSLKNIIKKHNKYKSDISGCKLVYPKKSDYQKIGKPQHLLNDHLDLIYNTIQHGGIHFIIRRSLFQDKSRSYYGSGSVLSPVHTWRFYSPDHPIASLDARCTAVTGALQIVKTDTFISLGGFNVGLSSAFQDIDLCLKAVEKNYSINYIGSEFAYHAESITQAKEKISSSPYFQSDHILWDVLWGVKLPKLIGLQYIFTN